MDLINKARLFGNYSLAFGKTQKVLANASEYLPKDFSALKKVLEQGGLSSEFVIKSFYKALAPRLSKEEFAEWQICMKAAVISKSVLAWKGEADFKDYFIAAITRGLPIMILKLEDAASFKAFEMKVIEGKSVEEAAMLAFGLSFDQYLELFAKHFNYSFLSEEKEAIVDFAHYLAQSFSNSDKKSSILWIESQAEMQKLGIEMSEDKWADTMAMLFVKIAELDDKFK